MEASDWDPRAPEVLHDQLSAYDAMRRRCPVAHSDYLHWSLFRHADVLQVVNDPQRFASAVSSHLSIPNGLDAPEHGPWRKLIEPYFAADRVAAFEPVARSVVRALVAQRPSGPVEWMEEFAHPCAVGLLCGFMQWDASTHGPLRDWARRNQAATLSGDRAAMEAVACEFDGQIQAQLELRRGDAHRRDDPTSRLLRERIEGRPLSDPEIVSILRNWTVGELATLSACAGILAHYLATHPQLQQELRARPDRLPPAIDEILRIVPPLVSNRRVTRCPVRIGGRDIPAGERLTLMWASANRDEAIFGDPDAFRPDRDPSLNLLYGAGVHVCPGALLSRMQLRVVVEEVFSGTRLLAPAGGEPVRARYPGSGFSVLPLHVEK